MEKILTFFLLMLSLTCWGQQEKTVVHVSVVDDQTFLPVPGAELQLVTKSDISLNVQTDKLGKATFYLENENDIFFAIAASAENYLTSYNFYDTISPGEEQSAKIYLHEIETLACFPATIYYRNQETTILIDYFIVDVMLENPDIKVKVITNFNFDETAELAQKRQQQFLDYAKSKGVDLSRFSYDKNIERKVLTVEIDSVEIELNQELFGNGNPQILKLYERKYQTINFEIRWE